MDQILEFISNNFGVVVSSVFVSTVLPILIRLIPKRKLMNLIPFKKLETSVSNAGMLHGQIISKFGNNKIGRKAMESLEESIAHTLIATLMTWTTGLYNIAIAYGVGLGKGLVSDNTKKSVPNQNVNNTEGK